MLLKDSIKYGPEFADAYSSLASLLAEQVTGTIQGSCFSCGVVHWCCNCNASFTALELLTPHAHGSEVHSPVCGYLESCAGLL